MNHQKEFIKVKFNKELIEKFYLRNCESDNENESSSDYECDVPLSETPLRELRKFLDPKGWILEGNRKELEDKLKEVMGQWSMDSCINRFVNDGDAFYIEENKPIRNGRKMKSNCYLCNGFDTILEGGSDFGINTSNISVCDNCYQKKYEIKKINVKIKKTKKKLGELKKARQSIYSHT